MTCLPRTFETNINYIERETNGDRKRILTIVVRGIIAERNRNTNRPVGDKFRCEQSTIVHSNIMFAYNIITNTQMFMQIARLETCSVVLRSLEDPNYPEFAVENLAAKPFVFRLRTTILARFVVKSASVFGEQLLKIWKYFSFPSFALCNRTLTGFFFNIHTTLVHPTLTRLLRFTRFANNCVVVVIVRKRVQN